MFRSAGAAVNDKKYDDPYKEYLTLITVTTDSLASVEDLVVHLIRFLGLKGDRLLKARAGTPSVTSAEDYFSCLLF